METDIMEIENDSVFTDGIISNNDMIIDDLDEVLKDYVVVIEPPISKNLLQRFE